MFKRIKETIHSIKDNRIRINIHRINAIDMTTNSYYNETNFVAEEFMRDFNYAVDSIQDKFEEMTGMRISKDFVVRVADGTRGLCIIKDKANKITSVEAYSDSDIMSYSLDCFSNYGISTYEFNVPGEIDGMNVFSYTVYSIPFVVIDYVYDNYTPRWVCRRISDLARAFNKFCPVALIEHDPRSKIYLDLNDGETNKIIIHKNINMHLFKMFHIKMTISLGKHSMQVATNLYRNAIRNLSFMPYPNIGIIELDPNYRNLSLYLCSINKELDELLGANIFESIYVPYGDVFKIIANSERHQLPARVLYKDFTPTPYLQYLYIIEFDWMLENGRGVITALNDYTREKLNFEERDLVQNEQGIRTPLIELIHSVNDKIHKSIVKKEETKPNDGISTIVLPSGRTFEFTILPYDSFAGTQSEWNKMIKDKIVSELEIDHKTMCSEEWLERHIDKSLLSNRIKSIKYMLFYDIVIIRYFNNSANGIATNILNRKFPYSASKLKRLLTNYNIEADEYAVWTIKEAPTQTSGVYYYTKKLPDDLQVGVYINKDTKDCCFYDGESIPRYIGNLECTSKIAKYIVANNDKKMEDLIRSICEGNGPNTIHITPIIDIYLIPYTTEASKSLNETVIEFDKNRYKNSLIVYVLLDGSFIRNSNSTEFEFITPDVAKAISESILEKHDGDIKDLIHCNGQIDIDNHKITILDIKD